MAQLGHPPRGFRSASPARGAAEISRQVRAPSPRTRAGSARSSPFRSRISRRSGARPVIVRNPPWTSAWHRVQSRHAGSPTRSSRASTATRCGGRGAGSGSRTPGTCTRLARGSGGEASPRSEGRGGRGPCRPRSGRPRRSRSPRRSPRRPAPARPRTGWPPSPRQDGGRGPRGRASPMTAVPSAGFLRKASRSAPANSSSVTSRPASAPRRCRARRYCSWSRVLTRSRTSKRTSGEPFRSSRGFSPFFASADCLLDLARSCGSRECEPVLFGRRGPRLSRSRAPWTRRARPSTNA